MAMSAQSESSPLDDRFDLEVIISGLASDLVAVRNGKMTVDAARANAELAKQIFNGIRLVVNVQRTLESSARQIGSSTE